MRQYKRKRIETSSPNLDARENDESYPIANKKGTATLQTSKSSNDLLAK